MENTKEMFILCKYKYIRHLTKKADSLTRLLLNNNGIDFSKKIIVENDQGLTDKELKDKIYAEKLEKKRLMKETCKPSAKNIEKKVFKEKEKYINITPIGDKKGKIFIFIFKI